ncbi:MAG: ergothioneine biosynthesis protein EgtB, partial [Hyphomicrobiales bacterium]
DMVVQAMDDASPMKWHLAHTTWFFEAFVLRQHDPEYRMHDDRFAYCFNSYYEAEGERHPRAHRGLLTRPSAVEVRGYRAHVDEALDRFMASGPSQAALELIELGINHEQQHQELMLTDILALFAAQPLRPVYLPEPARGVRALPALRMIPVHGGIRTVGHNGNGFAYDNEGPRHEVLVRPFGLASRTVTNGEWLEFMAGGGYETVSLWLSDGWAAVNAGRWRAPLYWERRDGEWLQMTLHGLLPVDPAAPVCHISYYEADAFARWAGRRLPTEFEWEVAADAIPPLGQTAGSGVHRPLPAGAGEGLREMFGGVWEWTASAYLPYPGFRAAPGAVGEYNGKFMCNQFVLRGGSCATPDGHVRATYRNFFYPASRWQFMGLRLAEDE